VLAPAVAPSAREAAVAPARRTLSSTIGTWAALLLSAAASIAAVAWPVESRTTCEAGEPEVVESSDWSTASVAGLATEAGGGAGGGAEAAAGAGAAVLGGGGVAALGVGAVTGSAAGPAAAATSATASGEELAAAAALGTARIVVSTRKRRTPGEANGPRGRCGSTGMFFEASIWRSSSIPG
jgi:hypothetical protein